MGFGEHAIKSMGRALSAMSHIKRSIVYEKAPENCLTDAIIIANTIIDNYANYKPCSPGSKIRPIFRTFLQETGIDLSGAAGIPELV